eukprot:1631877-Prymnesium_polylepis.2
MWTCPGDLKGLHPGQRELQTCAIVHARCQHATHGIARPDLPRDARAHASRAGRHDPDAIDPCHRNRGGRGAGRGGGGSRRAV